MGALGWRGAFDTDKKVVVLKRKKLYVINFYLVE
jgi:hypothetical protein